MAYVNTDLNCCGLGELCEVGYESDVVDSLKSVYGMTRIAHIIFTYSPENAVHGHYGNKLMAVISKNKLGPVVRTPPRMNKNSGNKVRAYLWSPNWDAFDAFAAKRGWSKNYAW